MHAADDFGPTGPVCHVRDFPPRCEVVSPPMPRAKPPTHRPIWMVVLAATMLLFGGGELVGGMVALLCPGARSAIGKVARAPAAEEAARKLEPILAAIVDHNRS